MPIRLRRKCPRCGNTKLLREPSRWWMRAFPLRFRHFVCDNCDLDIAVLLAN